MAFWWSTPPTHSDAATSQFILAGSQQTFQAVRPRSLPMEPTTAQFDEMVKPATADARRQVLSVRECAVTAAERFARGVKRAWQGERSQEDVDSMASWVESAGTRTLQRDDHQIVAA